MPAPQSVVYGVAESTRTGDGGPGGDGARRSILLTAVGPLITGYVGITAVLALVTATAPGTTFSMSGALAAAGPVWLAGYHVPVDIAGRELGVLPLLPTALLLLLVARTAGNAARRRELAGPRAAGTVIGPVAAAHALFAVLLALLCSGDSVSVSPVLAFFVTGVLGAVAATIGVARPCGLVSAVVRRADPATEAGLRAGGLAVLGMVAVGAVVFAAGLITSWSTAVRLFAAAPDVGSGLGMVLLCVAYLPNAVIATLSCATGPGVGIGVAWVGQWRFHAGPLPAVPLLAPLPAVEAHWWVFLMLLPAGVGVLVGLACRRYTDQFGTRLRAVLLAALVAGVGCLVLAALAGGPLAGGPFDPVTVPAGALAVSVFLFVAVPGALTVRLVGRGPGLLATDPAADQPAEFDDEEPFDDEPPAAADDEPPAATDVDAGRE